MKRRDQEEISKLYTEGIIDRLFSTSSADPGLLGKMKGLKTSSHARDDSSRVRAQQDREKRELEQNKAHYEGIFNADKNDRYYDSSLIDLDKLNEEQERYLLDEPGVFKRYVNDIMEVYKRNKKRGYNPLLSFDKNHSELYDKYKQFLNRYYYHQIHPFG